MAEIPAGYKVRIAKCGHEYVVPKSAGGGLRVSCPECIQKRMDAYLADPTVRPTECIRCGAVLEINISQGRFKLYCSRACLLSIHITASKASGEDTYLRGHWIVDSERQKIYERDGWICQICFAPVDPTVEWPDNMSPTLDHKIPWRIGDSHDPSVLQLAHKVCNSRKRNTDKKIYEKSTEKLAKNRERSNKVK